MDREYRKFKFTFPSLNEYKIMTNLDFNVISSFLVTKGLLTSIGQSVKLFPFLAFSKYTYVAIFYVSLCSDYMGASQECF